MYGQNLFNKGFPTNRIPISLPSTGQDLVLRETTVVELKSICKTIIDNINRRQMNVIYDAMSEYLQSMILTDGVEVSNMTELDRLYCLMVFFQLSFYKDPQTMKCPNCGTDIVYRYDVSKYIDRVEKASIDPQKVEIDYKQRLYVFDVAWPTVSTMSGLMNYFYQKLGTVTQEMEQTQFGIYFVFSFIRSIKVVNMIDGEREGDPFIDLTQIQNWKDRADCINSLPSMVVFDQQNGLFQKVMGLFINRLENCFSFEICPQCRKETDFGLPQSQFFYSLFYGSMKGMYGFILQVECLLLYRYNCCVFDAENYMTYNDLSNLTKQISATMEKENEDRRRSNKDNFTKGLWYIREILNTMIFPQDKVKG